MKTYAEYTLISEDYESRVWEIARAADHYFVNKTASKKNVEFWIEIAARNRGVTEISLSEKDRRRFIKDVRRAMVGGPAKIAVKTKEQRKRYPSSKQDKAILAGKFAGMAINKFPFGDPTPDLKNWIKSQGWDPNETMGKVLDKAVRKHLKTKNARDYMARIWDKHAAKSKRVSPSANPWRPMTAAKEEPKKYVSGGRKRRLPKIW